MKEEVRDSVLLKILNRVSGIAQNLSDPLNFSHNIFGRFKKK